MARARGATGAIRGAVDDLVARETTPSTADRRLRCCAPTATPFRRESAPRAPSSRVFASAVKPSAVAPWTSGLNRLFTAWGFLLAAVQQKPRSSPP